MDDDVVVVVVIFASKLFNPLYCSDEVRKREKSHGLYLNKQVLQLQFRCMFSGFRFDGYISYTVAGAKTLKRARPGQKQSTLNHGNTGGGKLQISYRETLLSFPFSSFSFKPRKILL